MLTFNLKPGRGMSLSPSTLFGQLLDVTAPPGIRLETPPVDKGVGLGQRGNVFQVAHVKLLRLRDAVTTTQ